MVVCLKFQVPSLAETTQSMTYIPGLVSKIQLELQLWDLALMEILGITIIGVAAIG